MAMLGRLTNSLLSGTNENNVALATLNFDFTLLKVEAPTEFGALASALSTYRRNDAEEGLPHKTARRLGALFQDIIPPTPKLIAAYGTRISEVVQTPGINPSGSESHGPFENFVGADGTTLWAAATSGVAAIGVYLLSCLLARAWDAKQSTSLWVELIAARKREVEQAFKDSHLISSSSLFSARQDISRDDLARWDSSARSWLRSADQAKNWEQHQLALILKNICLPFTSGPSTYTSVMDVWREAMVGMEALLCGRPLSVSTGSLFLAFSAWHLFPNLIVLGNETVEIKFRDKLVPSCAIVTVGKQSVTSDEKGGLQWSLALSHFHYYGGPIVVQSYREYSRVTFHELRLITFGGLLGAWRIGPRDQIPVAQWFRHLSKLLQQTRLGSRSTKLSRHFGWLENLVRAAEDLCTSNGLAKDRNLQLIKYGSRRARYFLTEDPYKMSPFFGLGSPPVLAGLSQELDVDCGIEFLRAIARDLGLTDREAIICYTLNTHKLMDRRKVENFEYTTAVPHTVLSRKRDAEGQFTLQQMHTRWTYKSSNSTTIEKDSTSPVFVQKEGPGRCVSGVVIWDETWDSFNWREVPRVYRDRTCASLQNPECKSTSSSTDKPPSACHCFETTSAPELESRSFAFRLVTGSCRLGLFLLESKWKNVFQSSSYCRNASGDESMTVIPSVGLKNFSDSQVKSQKLWDYMCLIIRGPQVNDEVESPGGLPGITFISDYHKLSIPCCQSLHALDIASTVYRNLENATISLKLISRPLYGSQWLPKPLVNIERLQDTQANIDGGSTSSLEPVTPTLLSRQQSFACIAEFESGTLDLFPEELDNALAMCSEDSIFVAARALSDPFDEVAPHSIKRLVGNIGRSGICFLVAPQNPRIRDLSDQYNLVTHAPYDSRRENNFMGTSLHLSFTDWQFPLNAGGIRTIDQDVVVVESVISVLDRGKWVADLDLLSVDLEDLLRIGTSCQCEGVKKESDNDYTSIDSWDELLDKPETVGVFRAHGNWAARLAAVSILSQQGHGHSICIFGPSAGCMKCLESEYEEFLKVDLSENESPLPSFCID